MIGIEKFKSYFKDYEGEYVIIGGTACELLMQAEELPFRATKDIDLVFIIESLTPEFGKAFWSFVKDAGYQFINKNTGHAQFYRFRDPKSKDYPFMIEIFSRQSDWLTLYDEQVTAPIHIGEDISSLSAILLNNDYYSFLKDGFQMIDGISILKVEYMIP